MASIKLQLPQHAGEQLPPIENKTSVVLIGANGSGKTRMSVWIETHNSQFYVHRISAQKSLNMPPLTRPSDLEKSQANLWFGSTVADKNWSKRNYRWKNAPEIHLLDDFAQLIMDINKNIEAPLEKSVLEPLIAALWPAIEAEFSGIKQMAPAEEQSKSKTDIREPIEEILQLLRKQNSLISNPEELLPIPYFEYLQKKIFSGSNRREDEIASNLLRYLEETLGVLERNFEQNNIQLLDSIRFDVLFDFLIRFYERRESRSGERNIRRLVDMRDHYYYLLSQPARAISD